MKQTIKFQRVSLFRRVCSIFFDFILCVSIFFVIQAFVVQPIFEKSTDYYEKYQRYNDILEETGLYIYYEEVDGVSIVNSNYDKHLQDFYNSNYAKELGYDSETYYKIKWENCDRNSLREPSTEPLFIYSEDGENEYFTDNIYKVDTSGNYTTEIDSTKKEIVDKIYVDLVNEIVGKIQNIKEVKELTQKITAYTMLFYILALIPSILIVYLLIPMLFKDGTTLGKKMLQMKIVDAKTGRNPTKFQLFVRFVFFAFLQIVLGIFTYGMIPVISIIIIFVNKKRQTIHDLIASTLIVCNNYSEESNRAKEDIIEIVYDDGITEENDNKGEENEGK